MMSTAPIILKEGLIRKQGGRMKTWKNRWFVISSDDNVAYYNSQDKSKKINEFSLSGTELNVIQNDPYDTNGARWLFEIKCASPFVRQGSVTFNKSQNHGSTTDKRTRLTEFHETFLLCASSEEERDQWVYVLKRVMYRHRGGAVFGYPLEEIMEAESKSGYFVPRVVKDLVEFLESAGLDTEGIFRLPGRQKLINQLIDEYDRGEEVNLAEKGVDVHTAASVLKSYLRRLPEPLIPFSRFEEMSTYGSKFGIPLDDMSEVHSLVITGLSTLPVWSYNLLKYIISFLRQVSANEAVNKMSIKNLAAIHAPNILRMRHDTPELLATINMVITDTTSAFIENFDILFIEDFFLLKTVPKPDSESDSEPPAPEVPPRAPPRVPPRDSSEASVVSESNSEAPAASNVPSADFYQSAFEQMKVKVLEEQKLRLQLETDLACSKAKNEELVMRVKQLESENGRLIKKMGDLLSRHGTLA